METKVEKLKKGNLISYQYADSDTNYFGIVVSNTKKELILQSLDAPLLHEIEVYNEDEKKNIRCILYSLANKQIIKDLLEEHRRYGLQEEKEKLKDFKTLKKKKEIKELRKSIKMYRNLKFFYPHLVETLLPD